jgi:hypothetical protein
MALFKLLGFRRFAGEDEIKACVSKSRGEDGIEGDYQQARTLLIFASSKQQTWLAVTMKSLYLIVDDKRKVGPKVQWSMNIEDARPRQ